MPSRNTIRTDIEDSYYHVYARGGSRAPIFLEEQDYVFFVSLFARYLGGKPVAKPTTGYYPNYSSVVSLAAYCLMGNHFHLLIHQKEQGGMSAFMHALMSSYSRYFNIKYKRTGSLFENRYKSSLITADSYLMHISRYIHLNPRSWRLYPHSSIKQYRGKSSNEWLQTKGIFELFPNKEAYFTFLADYEDYRDSLAAIKHELADT